MRQVALKAGLLFAGNKMFFLKPILLRAAGRLIRDSGGRFFYCFRDEVKKVLQCPVAILFLRACFLSFHPEFVFVIYVMREVLAKLPLLKRLQRQFINFYPHMDFGRAMVSVLSTCPSGERGLEMNDMFQIFYGHCSLGQGLGSRYGEEAKVRLEKYVP